MPENWKPVGVFFLFTLPSPRKAGGATVDGSGFVRRVVVQGCVCVRVARGSSCGGFEGADGPCVYGSFL